MKYVLAVLLVMMVFVPLIATADGCATNWMQCGADSKVQITSFTMRATETIGAITEARILTTKRLQRRGISADQAKAVLAKTDAARALWDAARAVCRADEAGNCATKAGAAIAFAKLAQAQEALK